MTDTSSKYYTVKSRTMAYAIKFVSGEGFYRFTSEDGSEIYSFIRTSKFEKAMSDLFKIRQPLD